MGHRPLVETPPNARNIVEAAPKARNMIARGKREARRPWVTDKTKTRPEKAEITRRLFRPFRPRSPFLGSNQGRRAPLRFALAPGYYIPRLWRYSSAPSALQFRAFGATVPRLWRYRHSTLTNRKYVINSFPLVPPRTNPNHFHVSVCPEEPS